MNHKPCGVMKPGVELLLYGGNNCHTNLGRLGYTVRH
jgi:hypothetical protein